MMDYVNCLSYSISPVGVHRPILTFKKWHGGLLSIPMPFPMAQQPLKLEGKPMERLCP